MSIASARVPSERPPQTERRKAVRFPWRLETAGLCVIADDNAPRPVKVKDISTKGIGLQVHRPFERGTVLDLERESPDHALSYKLRTRVAHVTPQTNGVWLLGCALPRKLADDELRALL